MRFSVITVICLLSFQLTTYAQIRFQRVYGGQSYDMGREVIQTSDDGYLIAGTTGSFGLESAQIMLLKTDADGYVEWRRYYGGPYADHAESMSLTTDGNLIIGGYSERVGLGYQAYALKLTMQGDTVWSHHYGGPLWEFGRKIVPLADGGYAFFGQTFSQGEGNGDFYLLRLDSSGDTLWTRTYGGAQEDNGMSIALASDGGFFLAGNSKSFGNGETDAYVVRTDANGDTLWTRTYGGAQDEFCYAVASTSDDGFVIAGGTFNHTPDEGDFIVMKADANGTVLWSFIDDINADEYWRDVIEDQWGNIVVVGYTDGSNFGKQDARIMRLGADGIWNNVAVSHGSEENDLAFDVKTTSDNGYVMVGQTEGFLHRFDDVYLVKMDPNGDTDYPTLGLDEITVEGQSYSVVLGPNPLNGEMPYVFIPDYLTLIAKMDDPIELKLYNMMGQIVYQSEITSAQTPLPDLSLAKGVYTYRLTSGSSVLATGKAVSLK